MEKVTTIGIDLAKNSFRCTEWMPIARWRCGALRAETSAVASGSPAAMRDWHGSRSSSLGVGAAV
jgi:hypothetical protein